MFPCTLTPIFPEPQVLVSRLSMELPKPPDSDAGAGRTNQHLPFSQKCTCPGQGWGDPWRRLELLLFSGWPEAVAGDTELWPAWWPELAQQNESQRGHCGSFYWV